jgi:hypothetical protein
VKAKRWICTPTGKLMHSTRAAAMASAARLSRHAHYIRAYRCEFCRTWHLTSQRKRGCS